MNEKLQSSLCNNDGKMPSDLSEFHTLPSEYYPVIHRLEQYGKLSRYIFPESQMGPILVIFKEIHKGIGKEVRIDNIRGFMEMRGSVDFIVSEGSNSEFVHSGYFSGTTSNDFGRHISEISYALSTEALKEYYKDSLDTCGVDLKLDELMKVIKGYGKLRTIKAVKDYDRSRGIVPRNRLWLENIEILLLKNKKNRGEKAKNIVPIFTGGDHVDDLIIQARKRGFQGVIVFESPLYTGVIQKLGYSGNLVNRTSK